MTSVLRPVLVLVVAAAALAIPACEGAPIDLNDQIVGNGGAGGRADAPVAGGADGATPVGGGAMTGGGEGGGSGPTGGGSGPTGGGAGPTGGGATGGGSGPTGGTGGVGGAIINCETAHDRLDWSVFVDEVLPVIDGKCSGPSCHTGGAGPRDDGRLTYFGSPFRPLADLTDDELDQNFDEVIDFVDLCDPPQSDLLRYPVSFQDGNPSHPTQGPVMFTDEPAYLTRIDWMEAAIAPPPPPMPDAGRPGGNWDAGVDEPDAGNLPNPNPDPQPMEGVVPCEALPHPDRLSRYDYGRFDQHINPNVLGPRCGDQAGCHGEPGGGGGLWIRTSGECSTRWNFLAVQWFVDPRDVINSQLLTEPLDRRHGGQVVFDGQDDPGYVELKIWLEEGND